VSPFLGAAPVPVASFSIFNSGCAMPECCRWRRRAEVKNEGPEKFFPGRELSLTLFRRLKKSPKGFRKF
jgi:hypothetical protein